MEGLKKPFLGLPVWGWLAGLGAFGVAVFVFWHQSSSIPATATAATTAATDTTSGFPNGPYPYPVYGNPTPLTAGAGSGTGFPTGGVTGSGYPLGIDSGGGYTVLPQDPPTITPNPVPLYSTNPVQSMPGSYTGPPIGVASSGSGPITPRLGWYGPGGSGSIPAP